MFFTKSKQGNSLVTVKVGAAENVSSLGSAVGIIVGIIVGMVVLVALFWSMKLLTPLIFPEEASVSTTTKTTPVTKRPATRPKAILAGSETLRIVSAVTDNMLGMRLGGTDKIINNSCLCKRF